MLRRASRPSPFCGLPPSPDVGRLFPPPRVFWPKHQPWSFPRKICFFLRRRSILCSNRHFLPIDDCRSLVRGSAFCRAPFLLPGQPLSVFSLRVLQRPPPIPTFSKNTSRFLPAVFSLRKNFFSFSGQLVSPFLSRFLLCRWSNPRISTARGDYISPLSSSRDLL